MQKISIRVLLPAIGSYSRGTKAIKVRQEYRDEPKRISGTRRFVDSDHRSLLSTHMKLLVKRKQTNNKFLTFITLFETISGMTPIYPLPILPVTVPATLS